MDTMVTTSTMQSDYIVFIVAVVRIVERAGGAGYFWLGLSSACRSPSTYCMPASTCSSIGVMA
jgi:hypothetical protein